MNCAIVGSLMFRATVIWSFTDPDGLQLVLTPKAETGMLGLFDMTLGFISIIYGTWETIDFLIVWKGAFDFIVLLIMRSF